MNESRASRYQRYRRRARRAGLLSGGVMLAALAWTPAAGVVAGWAHGAGGAMGEWARPGVELAVFVVALVALWEVALLPAMWLAGVQARGRRPRERPSFAEALSAQWHATLIAMPAALVAAVVIRIAGEVSSSWWWLGSGAVLAFALMGALRAGPSLIARLAGVRPVDRPALIERLGALSRRLRVPIASIDELTLGDTSTATALVAGTGQARRVFIGSELIRDWSDEEVAVVVAHEMAHHAQHHLWQTAALDGAILSLGFWTAERALETPGAALAAGDLTALPRIALVVGTVWLAFTPLRHALSRHHERRADQFALELTGSVEAFRTALRRLAERHLAEERPSRLTRWFHHRHPTVAERLALADRFQDQIDR